MENGQSTSGGYVVVKQYEDTPSEYRTEHFRSTMDDAYEYIEINRILRKQMKNYLVKFKCVIGDYEHIDYMLFNKKKSEWGYCKEFWGISKKDELKENCFWDDWMQNAIKVYSETEITNEQVETLKQLGVVY